MDKILSKKSLSINSLTLIKYFFIEFLKLVFRLNKVL